MTQRAGTSRRRLAGAAGASALLLALAGYLWWPAQAPAQHAGASGMAAHTGALAATAHGAAPPSPFGAITHPAQLAPGTATAADDALLQPGLRDTLEALLLQAGDAPTPQALKQRLEALVRQHFGASLQARALELARRYVDYRVALGELKAPGDLSDPGALRAAIAERRGVRQRYFDDAEYGALFAADDDLDRYTLARLEVLHNRQLSDTQRQAALRQAETALPPAQRAERAAAAQYLGAAAQTATFNAQGTDDYARYAARSAAYGENAARALAQLDHAERNWQARLDEYAQAQAANTTAPALATLREQLFTPQEQLRIEGALALRQAAPSTASH